MGINTPNTFVTAQRRTLLLPQLWQPARWLIKSSSLIVPHLRRLLGKTVPVWSMKASCHCRYRSSMTCIYFCAFTLPTIGLLD
ncbi:MAG: hypothetical protein CM15mP120_30560 [Pseudomonadota bacterium]|nr:MAG: hypothetical protein CM15mP120_30560 [Pseudomonadota bacterium]